VHPQDEEVAVDAAADEDAAEDVGPETGKVPEEAAAAEEPQCRLFSVTPTV
jgi:hypothetical protein